MADNTNPDLRSAIQMQGQAVTLRIKVVPGASRDRVVGMLGDRLKLSVSAAPEAGKANKAVCKLLAEVLGVAPRSLEVTSGQSQPIKTITVTGITDNEIIRRLSQAMKG